MRLGFPVHVFGCRDLPAHDARPWYASPHLSVSLAYLYDILRYLQASAMHMYRLHARLLPREDTRDPTSELSECAAQLDAVGQLVTSSHIRLSVHAPTHLVPNALHEDQADEARAFFLSYAALLDSLNAGPEAVIVTHVGGVYKDRQAALDRFCARLDDLPLAARRRLALEQDDRRFSHADVRRIHERCGIPLVWDHLHHQILNPEGIPSHEALAYSLATWPANVVPKVHFASPRTEMRLVSGGGAYRPPSWTEHSDLVNPFEFIRFLELAEGLRPFDVMVEARARDLAVLHLRQDVARWAPARSATLT